MTTRLLLDEHFSDAVAVGLRERGHDVVSVVANADLRGASDPEVSAAAIAARRRIVTENVKDFRPLLLQAMSTGSGSAALLLVPPRRFPRGGGSRAAAITSALGEWLSQADADHRPIEDWLT